MAQGKMDWLRLETRIREALKAYHDGVIDSKQALDMIDDAIGEETGRGWELEETPV